MPKFRVMWEIDSDAPNPVMAAREAWDCMRRQDSIANVFEVIDCETRTSATVDLTQPACPACGNQHLQVCVTQWADVEFDHQGHNITDGPRGDIEWDDDSHVICSSNLEGCGWAGKLKECGRG